MINWKIRLKNKTFWITIIPMLFVLIKQIFAIFGYDIQLESISKQVVSIIETVFVILGLLGIVTDPTTAGVSDSARAMTYNDLHK